MFLATDGDNQVTFTTRAELFSYLEQENGKAFSQGVSRKLVLHQVDKEGGVLSTAVQALPFEGSLDDKLFHFGKEKEKRRVPYGRPVKSLDQEPAESKEDELKMPVSAPENPPKKSLLTAVLVMGLLLAYVGIGLSYVMTTNQTQKSLIALEEQVQVLTHQTQKEHHVDVFARYFFPHYFSGDKAKLKNFGKVKGLAPQTGQVLSVIMQDVTVTGQEVKATYILLVKTEAGQESIKAMIELRENDKSLYGYDLARIPVLEDFGN